MKKTVKYAALGLLFTGCCALGLYVTGNGYLLKGFWASYLHGYNSASIGDHRFFNTRAIDKAAVAEPWPVSDLFPIPVSAPLQQMIENTGTVAFLVFRHDSLQLEIFREEHDETMISNSFSMAKSITTLLAQQAIQKGYLKGWNQKVKELIPALHGQYAGELALWHLSTMSSGLEWDEQYKNPFSITAKAYYGEDISQLMEQLPIVEKPGKAFVYQSGSTQLLGMCVMRATGKKLAELAAEWLWKPMGAEAYAQWHTDNKGTELAYCCYNATALDFARFGKLLLHHGQWNGNQLVDSAFIALATKPALSPAYGYSFWLDNSHGTPVFYQRGILGQYIIVIPAYDAVIVRLGHERIPPQSEDPHTEDFHCYVEEVLKTWR